MGQVITFGIMVVQHFLQNFPIHGNLLVSSSIHLISIERKSKVQAMEDHIEYQQEVLQLLKDNLDIYKKIE